MYKKRPIYANPILKKIDEICDLGNPDDYDV